MSILVLKMNLSNIGLGCMRIAELKLIELEKLVMLAMENGINWFDHADIYGKGKSEQLFGQLLSNNPHLRSQIIIQTKCGIREGYYDNSYQHIMTSVEQSLARLQTDYLDILLIHRPDALVEPEQVDKAFTELKASGKVRAFGVSNHNSMQIELLAKQVSVPIQYNQLQFSVMHSSMIDAGIHVNTTPPAALSHDGYILDYCRLHQIEIQAWSPVQFGFFEGSFINNPLFPDLNQLFDELSPRYGVDSTTLAISWILTHPAGIKAISGTTNPNRLKSICQAADIKLSRQDWYAIYKATGNELP